MPYEHKPGNNDPLSIGGVIFLATLGIVMVVILILKLVFEGKT